MERMKDRLRSAIGAAGCCGFRNSTFGGRQPNGLPENCFEYKTDEDGVGFYEINRTSFSANTVRLKPNRDYLLSVLLQAEFERPTEVNMGLRTFDAGGKNVIDNLIGLPNKTNGWERFETEVHDRCPSDAWTSTRPFL